MSYGFSVTSGSAGTVTINSDNDAVGVYIDSFYVAYNTSVSKSYPDFYGSALFTIIIQNDRTKLNVPITNINNSTKVVQVTSTTQSAPARQNGFFVIVLGK